MLLLVVVIFVLLVPAKWSAGKVVSKMTYSVLSGTLKPSIPIHGLNAWFLCTIFTAIFVTHATHSYSYSWLLLFMKPVDIKSRWRHNWKSAHVVNSHLVCDPTSRQPGFDLPRQQWSLLNRFRMEQGHCGACRRKWRLTDADLCPCGETQTMFHIVESCPLTKLNGSLSRLHSADEDAVLWLTSYGLWHAYEKKKIHKVWQIDDYGYLQWNAVEFKKNLAENQINLMKCCRPSW